MSLTWKAQGKQALPYALLFLFALALRLVCIAEQARRNPLFGFPTVDAEYYSQWADQIVGGQWDWPDLRNYLPIYPWFLAICKWFFYGDDPWGVKVVQSVFSSLSCVLLAAVTARVFDRRAGLAAGLLFAANWLFVIYDGERYSETLCLSCLVLCLYCLLCQAPGWIRTLVGSLACALACACRPNLLPIVPLTAGWIFLHEQTYLRKWLHAAASLAVVGLIFTPVLLHNHRVSGRWALRAQQYWNSYAALEPAIGGLHPAAGIAFDKYMLRPVLVGAFSHEQADLYWKEQTFKLLHESTWPALKNYLLARAIIFTDATEWSQEFDVYAYRSYSQLLSLPWPGFGWVFPLACAGLAGLAAQWRGRPRPDRETILRQQFLVLFLVVVAAFTFAAKVTGRYRIPVTLMLTPFAGAGAAWLLSKEGRRPALFGAFFAGGLLSWPDWPDLRHRQTAMHDYYIGLLNVSEGRLDQAENAFRLGTERQPWNADAPCELARVLLQEHRIPEAMAAVDEAVRREPVFWKAWNLKAAIATDQQKYDDALAALDRSLAIYPQQPEPWMQKKQVYAATGRWEEEDAAYRHAIDNGAGAAFAIEYALALEDHKLFPQALLQLSALLNDATSTPRFDRARACLLLGDLAAIDLHQLEAARARWKQAADQFPDVAFVADQAQFLLGNISAEEYARRVKTANAETASRFFDFNRGLVALLAKDYPNAESALLECLSRSRLNTDSPRPESIPEKWAWQILRARPKQSEAPPPPAPN
jgi:tetratricopeptide (TPR) repeat protein